MRSPHKSIVLLVTLLVALVFPATASTHPVHAAHAIVVSVHELASHVGMDVMKAGGNAVDAAVATGFVLAVVHPAAGNIGGGGFMLVRMADGRTTFIDFREKAPAAASHDMYLDANKKPTRDQIVAHMDGNICRCGTYPRIVKAIQRAAKEA